MTDFVVSKVAMSVCALMTALILADVISLERFYDREGELEAVAEEFRDLAESLMASEATSSAVWTVPALHDGTLVLIVVEPEAIKAVSEDREASAATTVSIHSWAWNGSPMNMSDIIQLDLDSRPVRARSGEDVRVYTTRLTLENEATLCAFAEWLG